MSMIIRSSILILILDFNSVGASGSGSELAGELEKSDHAFANS